MSPVTNPNPQVLDKMMMFSYAKVPVQQGNEKTPNCSFSFLFFHFLTFRYDTKSPGNSGSGRGAGVLDQSLIGQQKEAVNDD